VVGDEVISVDTYNRTFAKTATYRVATFVFTYLITFALTGATGLSTTMAILSLTVGALSFIIHERLWTKVRWGNLGGIDFKIRSFVKTLTYRLWSLFIVFVLSIILGLHQQEALVMTIALNVMYMLTHYINERVWNRISWGKV